MALRLRKRGDRPWRFLAIGIAILVGVLFYLDWQQFERANAEATRSRGIMRTTRSVIVSLTEAESAQRGYLLTGNAKYLQPYRIALRRLFPKETNDLYSEVSSAHRNLQKAARLVALARQKVAEMEQTTRIRDEQGPAAALSLLDHEEGLQAMQDARKAAGAIDTDEWDRMLQNSRSAAEHAKRSRLIIVLGCLVLVALLFRHGKEVDRVVDEREKLALHLDESRLQLQVTNEKLRQSNADLEQFAYAASHDLQEPLRMVSIYSQLLKEDYGGHLNEEGVSYINFAIEGSIRMETLLRGLLTYSRVAKDPEDVGESDANNAVEQALLNLAASVQETSAEVKVEPLPSVRVAQVHLVQLFQNLIGNSLKYRRRSYHGGDRLTIHIEAKREVGSPWLFAVRDNGIGIDSKYLTQIFGVFKRLHGQEYEGAGIGLALCQKIVERANGKIWAESTPGSGTAILFTLPGVD